MPRFNDRWTVQPHGPLEQIDQGLLSVEGDIRMPLGNFPRRMTVVGLEGGRCAIWSAMPLREPEMQRIEALGTPAFLIVPGVAHRLDIRAWKQRYPQAQVLCTPGAKQAVEEVVPVDSITNIMNDARVQLQAVPGVDGQEAALLVRRERRTTLVVNDILAHVRHPHGLGAHIMARLMGFGVDGPRMPWLGRRMFVKDAAALASAFRHWAQEPGLARIIVSHGDVITQEPAAVLERVAASLER